MSFAPSNSSYEALLHRVELIERRTAETHTHGAADTFWLLFCGALINFMQVRFAAACGTGASQKKEQGSPCLE